MAFGFFKKKEKTLDLRTNKIPVPKQLQDKYGDSGSSSVQVPTPSSSSSPSSNTDSSSGSGFFNFFGSNDSSSNSNSSTSSSSTSSSDSYNSYNSPSPYSPSSNTQTDEIKNRLTDLSANLSRIADRIELLEKKMDRVERKSGVSGY